MTVIVIAVKIELNVKSMSPISADHMSVSIAEEGSKGIKL